MDEKYISINDKIFELLRNKGITQKELSDMTGISTSAISDWKHKGSVPSALNVKKICKALNVDAEVILGKTNEGCTQKIVLEADDELFNFVNMYEELPQARQKRILSYAIAMMKTELDH